MHAHNMQLTVSTVSAWAVFGSGEDPHTPRKKPLGNSKHCSYNPRTHAWVCHLYIMLH